LARSLAEDAMDIEGATEFDEVQSFLKQLDKKRDAIKAEDVLLSAERAIEQRDVKTAQKFLDEYLKGDHGANKPKAKTLNDALAEASSKENAQGVLAKLTDEHLAAFAKTGGSLPLGTVPDGAMQGIVIDTLRQVVDQEVARRDAAQRKVEAEKLAILQQEAADRANRKKKVDDLKRKAEAEAAAVVPNFVKGVIDVEPLLLWGDDFPIWSCLRWSTRNETISAIERIRDAGKTEEALLAVAKVKRGSKVVKDQLQYGSALVAMILMGSQKVSEGFASANRDNRFINFLVRRVLRKANEKKALESKPAKTGTKHPIMLTNPGWAMLAADAGLDDAKEAFTTRELTLRRSRLRLDFEILSARQLKEAKTDEEVFRVMRKRIPFEN
jgi:hypothetical protein